MIFFCATPNFWDIVDFINVFVHNFLSVFTDQIWSKIMYISEDAQCSEMEFCVMSFFCAILSFWDMVDFVFNRAEYKKRLLNTGRFFFAKYAVDANQWG